MLGDIVFWCVPVVVGLYFVLYYGAGWATMATTLWYNFVFRTEYHIGWYWDLLEHKLPERITAIELKHYVCAGVVWFVCFMVTGFVIGEDVVNATGESIGCTFDPSAAGMAWLWVLSPVALTLCLRFGSDIVRALKHNFKTGKSERLDEQSDKLAKLQNEIDELKSNLK